MARRGFAWTPATILYIVAVVIFVLAAFGVDIGGDVGLIALGLAAFAAAHVF